MHKSDGDSVHDGERKTRHSGMVVIPAFRRLDKKITKISYKREK